MQRLYSHFVFEWHFVRVTLNRLSVRNELLAARHETAYVFALYLLFFIFDLCHQSGGQNGPPSVLCHKITSHDDRRRSAGGCRASYVR